MSILKPQKLRQPLQAVKLENIEEDEDSTEARRRRVSFAGVNKIKEFNSDAESVVICDTPAYEEEFTPSSDSSHIMKDLIVSKTESFGDSDMKLTYIGTDSIPVYSTPRSMSNSYISIGNTVRLIEDHILVERTQNQDDSTNFSEDSMDLTGITSPKDKPSKINQKSFGVPIGKNCSDLCLDSSERENLLTPYVLNREHASHHQSDRRSLPPKEILTESFNRKSGIFRTSYYLDDKNIDKSSLSKQSCISNDISKSSVIVGCMKSNYLESCQPDPYSNIPPVLGKSVVNDVVVSHSPAHKKYRLSQLPNDSGDFRSVLCSSQLSNTNVVPENSEIPHSYSYLQGKNKFSTNKNEDLILPSSEYSRNMNTEADSADMSIVQKPTSPYRHVPEQDKVSPVSLSSSLLPAHAIDSNHLRISEPDANNDFEMSMTCVLKPEFNISSENKNISLSKGSSFPCDSNNESYSKSMELLTSTNSVQSEISNLENQNCIQIDRVKKITDEKASILFDRSYQKSDFNAGNSRVSPIGGLNDSKRKLDELKIDDGFLPNKLCVRVDKVFHSTSTRNESIPTSEVMFSMKHGMAQVEKADGLYSQGEVSESLKAIPETNFGSSQPSADVLKSAEEFSPKVEFLAVPSSGKEIAGDEDLPVSETIIQDGMFNFVEQKNNEFDRLETSLPKVKSFLESEICCAIKVDSINSPRELSLTLEQPEPICPSAVAADIDSSISNELSTNSTFDDKISPSKSESPSVIRLDKPLAIGEIKNESVKITLNDPVLNKETSTANVESAIMVQINDKIVEQPDETRKQFVSDARLAPVDETPVNLLHHTVNEVNHSAMDLCGSSIIGNQIEIDNSESIIPITTELTLRDEKAPGQTFSPLQLHNMNFIEDMGYHYLKWTEWTKKFLNGSITLTIKLPWVKFDLETPILEASVHCESNITNKALKFCCSRIVGIINIDVAKMKVLDDSLSTFSIIENKINKIKPFLKSLQDLILYKPSDIVNDRLEIFITSLKSNVAFDVHISLCNYESISKKDVTVVVHEGTVSVHQVRGLFFSIPTCREKFYEFTCALERMVHR